MYKLVEKYKHITVKLASTILLGGVCIIIIMNVVNVMTPGFVTFKF